MFGFRARLSVWSELELGVTLLTFQSEIVFNLADFSRFFFVVSRFQIESFLFLLLWEMAPKGCLKARLVRRAIIWGSRLLSPWKKARTTRGGIKRPKLGLTAS